MRFALTASSGSLVYISCAPKEANMSGDMSVKGKRVPVKGAGPSAPQNTVWCHSRQIKDHFVAYKRGKSALS